MYETVQSLRSEIIVDSYLIRMTPYEISIDGCTKTFTEWKEIFEMQRKLKNVTYNGITFLKKKTTAHKIEKILELYYPNYFTNQTSIATFLQIQNPIQSKQIRDQVIQSFNGLEIYEQYVQERERLQSNLALLKLEAESIQSREKFLLQRLTDIESFIKQYQSYKEFYDVHKKQIDFNYLKLFQAYNVYISDEDRYAIVGINAKFILLELWNPFDELKDTIMKDLRKIFHCSITQQLHMRPRLITEFSATKDHNTLLYEISYDIKGKV